MAVVRINKTRDYTVMSNHHFKEKEMSLKAKGLLSLMLSLPDEWDYSVMGLVSLSKDGKDSVMNALNELEEFGYLVRTKITDEKGRFCGYDYDIFEEPNTENPYAENPNAEEPNAEEPPQLNTNQSTTNQSSTKESNTNKKERKEEPLGYDGIVSQFDFTEEVKATIFEFVKMRKLMKKPMTNFAFKKILNKLLKISTEPKKQIMVLEKSILNNWQDIYELKEEKTEPKEEPKPVRRTRFDIV